ncbi:Crp/Fnr family transcriptional regulator [Sporolactobacillus sp. THM7-4]|nr:Crp/Fnr family transcriptional regulator [Sporolactobacillus sp. THM7-4]
MKGLQAVGWLEGLSDQDIQWIERQGAYQSYQARETIFLQGEELTAYFFVLEGLVSTYHQNEEGKKWIASLFSRGDFFPHVGLMNQQHKYPACCEAIAASTLFVLPRGSMDDVFHKFPSIREHLTVFLTEKSQELISRFSDSVLESASHRLVSFLKKLSAKSGNQGEDGWCLISHDMTEQDMAEYIGVTPETISRILHRLYRESRARKVGRKQISVNLKRL